MNQKPYNDGMGPIALLFAILFALSIVYTNWTAAERNREFMAHVAEPTKAQPHD